MESYINGKSKSFLTKSERVIRMSGKFVYSGVNVLLLMETLCNLLKIEVAEYLFSSSLSAVITEVVIDDKK